MDCAMASPKSPKSPYLESIEFLSYSNASGIESESRKDSQPEDTPQPKAREANKPTLTKAWTRIGSAVKRDWKLMRWWRGWGWFFFMCWIGFALFALVMLSSISGGDGYNPNSSACHPDGNFSPFEKDYNWWTVDGIFQVTLGFGTFTFAQAKIVDVVWDVIVGQIGQLVAAFVSFKVFADYVTVSMATAPVTYTTFWAIYLHQETSTIAWARLMREFWRGGVLKSKVAMAFIASTMLFLISFPTLASAMTGYTPIIEAFIRRNDSSLIPFTDLAKTAYVIHDGSRINLTDNYAVPFAYASGREQPLSLADGARWLDFIQTCGQSGSSEGFECLLANVSSYVSQYGFYGLTKTNTTWNKTTLEPPALNITAFFLPSQESEKTTYTPYYLEKLYGANWTDPRTGNKPFTDPRNRTYHDSQGNLYSLDYVMASGTCQPITDGCDVSSAQFLTDACSVQKYHWGFSVIQAVIGSALALIWTMGLYIMYLTAHLQLPLVDAPEVPQGWRAVIHLGEAMRRELDRNGIDPDKMTDKQLKTLISKQLNGGSVTFQEQLKNPGRGFRQAWRQWLRREKWWLMSFSAGLVIGLLAVFASMYNRPNLDGFIFGITVCSACAGIFLGLNFGRTKTSKWLFTILCGLLGFALTMGFMNRRRKYY